MSRFTRRHFGAVALAGATGLLAACSGEMERAASVVDGSVDRMLVDYVGYSPLTYLVRDRGFLEARMLDTNPALDLDYFPSGYESDAIEAASSGRYLLATSSGSTILEARSRGAALKAVAVASEPNWCGLVTRKGSKLTTPAQLRGQSVAVTANSEAFYYLLRLLDSAGLGIDDIDPLYLAHDLGLAALRDGRAAAWVGFSTSLAQVQHELPVMHRDPLWTTHCFLVTHEDVLATRRAEVQAAVNAYQDARRWAFLNTGRAYDKLTIDMQQSNVVVRDVLNDSNTFVDRVPGEAHLERLQAVGGIMVRAGIITEGASLDAALSGFFEPSIAEAAPALDYVALAANPESTSDG
ncbi:ABC transporter substrate-binding protein [Micrococcales bacterium 31B]|nr:ABC transporter substrate-binding protein [Micrococcales bacterium 31B]